MDFLISRTSAFETVKPCEEATPITATYLDYRKAKSLDEAKTKHWGEDWFSWGTNHREENGRVVRDLYEYSVWLIKIDNLDGLIRLQHKYGELVIRQGNYKGYPMEIEIYDSYRE